MKWTKGLVVIVLAAVLGISGCGDAKAGENFTGGSLAEEGRSGADKQTVVLGCMAADTELKRMVNEFNVENDTYQIECREYGYDDDAVRRVSTEFAAGNGPDLISLNMIDVEEFVHKNLLEDLEPFLQESDSLGREDLVEPVLRCNTVKGKLVCIPPEFAIDTLMGKSSEVGGEPGWTMEEFMSCVKAHEGAEIFEGPQWENPGE